MLGKVVPTPEQNQMEIINREMAGEGAIILRNSMLSRIFKVIMSRISK